MLLLEVVLISLCALSLFCGAEAADEPQSVDELPEGASDDALDDTCGFCRFMKSGPCGKIFKVPPPLLEADRKAE